MRGNLILVLGIAVTTSMTACSPSTGSSPPWASAATTAAAPPGTQPPPVDPTNAGPYPVGYLELSVTDAARNRTLPVSVWFPAERSGTTHASYKIIAAFAVQRTNVSTDVPIATGAHPTILFSHGSGGTRFQSWFLTEQLASLGFIVVAPDHPGNTFNDQQTVENIARAAQERPKDVRVLLDDILRRNTDANDALSGRIDPARIGMMGHSYGGYTTLTMAGGSAFGDPPDPRIKAIAPLAPAASIIPEANLRAITVPILLMGGTLDTTTPPVSEVLRTYDLVGSTTKYRVVITDANHDTYSIECGAQSLLDDPSIPPDLQAMAKAYIARSCGPEVIRFDQASQLIERYVVSFFETTLLGDSRYRPFLSSADRVSFAGT